MKISSKLTIMDDKLVKLGKDFRIGYEETHTGTDLTLWIKIKMNKTAKFSISPIED